MAEEDSQERTEEASEKRKREAREKGQIARSREFNTMALLLGSSIGMIMFSERIAQYFMQIFYKCFTPSREWLFSPRETLIQVVGYFDKTLYAFLPFMIFLAAIAFLSPMAIGGLAFSFEIITLKFERLDPISGLKKMFSTKSLIDLVQAILKFTLVLIVFSIIMYNYWDEIFQLGKLPVNNGISSLCSILLHAFLFLSTSLIIIAGVDIPLQIWNISKQLKMTKHEVKEEAKETEGRPEVKSKLRRMQRELRRRRMMHNVPKADVIITNPEHYAVAVQYDENTMSAPKLLAKGTDLISEMIKKVAKAHNIPLVRAPDLARSIYYNVEIEEEIPSGLYVAVARVLAYVYELKLYKKGKRDKPVLSRDLPIPEHLQRDSI